jgi:hypothetical protein
MGNDVFRGPWCSRWGHEGIWKLGDEGGTGHQLRSFLIYTDTISNLVGYKGLYFFYTNYIERRVDIVSAWKMHRNDVENM